MGEVMKSSCCRSETLRTQNYWHGFDKHNPLIGILEKLQSLPNRGLFVRIGFPWDGIRRQQEDPSICIITMRTFFCGMF